LSADAEAALHGILSGAVAGLARAYLTTAGGFGAAPVIARDGPLADAAAAAAPADDTKSEEDALVALAVDRDLAHRFVVTATRAGVGEAGPVARRTGRSITDAAAAVALVGRAAGVDHLVEAVGRALAVVPAPSRLTAWQGRALLDDLHAWRRAAAISALTENPGPPAEAVAAWEAAHQAELTRANLLLNASRPASTDPLAVTALVLRRLQLAV
jgi:NAD-specific glutamate dehydrogenase